MDYKRTGCSAAEANLLIVLHSSPRSQKLLVSMATQTSDRFVVV